MDTSQLESKLATSPCHTSLHPCWRNCFLVTRLVFRSQRIRQGNCGRWRNWNLGKLKQNKNTRNWLKAFPAIFFVICFFQWRALHCQCAFRVVHHPFHHVPKVVPYQDHKWFQTNFHLAVNVYFFGGGCSFCIYVFCTHWAITGTLPAGENNRFFVHITVWKKIW